MGELGRDFIGGINLLSGLSIVCSVSLLARGAGWILIPSSFCLFGTRGLA